MHPLSTGLLEDNANSQWNFNDDADVAARANSGFIREKCIMLDSLNPNIILL